MLLCIDMCRNPLKTEEEKSGIEDESLKWP